MSDADRGDVVVLGSANMDLVVRQPRRAEPGETIFGTAFTTGAGGKGLNQAVAAARAGARVVFLGAVGADAFGERLRQRLVADGVEVSGLRVSTEATGIAQITVTDDGENTIVVVPGANDDVEFSPDDQAAVAAASHLVVQGERPIPLLATAMRHAREAGVTTVLTPAPASRDLEALLDLTDLLVPNENEALELSGSPDAAEAAARLSRRAGTVIVTRGAHGALVARDGAVVFTLAAPVVTPVDTTAAGDTFVGVLVAWLADGAALEVALSAAAAAAAITVTRAGAAESMPHRDEIDRALSAPTSPS
ncbi:ribokinase [Microbacterium sp. P04]|uniref:ribokinase n=1 Tax=Microbacterium sp. P04 TaxID=3366947 RepID=UPI0037466238